MEELDTISQLTNLNSLRGKRTFRKEQIAKHKLIKEYLERPIRDVTKEDIGTISRDLHLDLKIFNTLQSRIHVLTEDKIKSEEEQAAAELKLEEIKAKHRECQRHLLHLKTRYELYQEGFTLEDDFNSLESDAGAGHRLYAKPCNKLTGRISSYLEKYRAHPTDEQIQDLCHKFKLLRTTVNQRMKISVKDPKPEAEVKPVAAPIHNKSFERAAKLQ